MDNIKTTVAGFITSLAVLLSHFGIIIPESFQMVILAVGVFIISLLTKDAKPTT